LVIMEETDSARPYSREVAWSMREVVKETEPKMRFEEKRVGVKSRGRFKNPEEGSSGGLEEKIGVITENGEGTNRKKENGKKGFTHPVQCWWYKTGGVIDRRRKKGL